MESAFLSFFAVFFSQLAYSKAENKDHPDCCPVGFCGVKTHLEMLLLALFVMTSLIAVALGIGFYIFARRYRSLVRSSSTRQQTADSILVAHTAPDIKESLGETQNITDPTKTAEEEKPLAPPMVIDEPVMFTEDTTTEAPCSKDIFVTETADDITTSTTSCPRNLKTAEPPTMDLDEVENMKTAVP